MVINNNASLGISVCVCYTDLHDQKKDVKYNFDSFKVIVLENERL